MKPFPKFIVNRDGPFDPKMGNDKSPCKECLELGYCKEQRRKEIEEKQHRRKLQTLLSVPVAVIEEHRNTVNIILDNVSLNIEDDLQLLSKVMNSDELKQLQQATEEEDFDKVKDYILPHINEETEGTVLHFQLASAWFKTGNYVEASHCMINFMDKDKLGLSKTAEKFIESCDAILLQKKEMEKIAALPQELDNQLDLFTETPKDDDTEEIEISKIIIDHLCPQQQPA